MADLAAIFAVFTSLKNANDIAKTIRESGTILEGAEIRFNIILKRLSFS